MPEIAMSQPPLSSDSAPSIEIAQREMAAKLKRYLREDLQPNFRRHLLVKLQDPFTQGLNGGFKLSVLWAGLEALGVLALSVFVYFNFVRS
jgi:hypothetical protein